jgi:hypothetical protein
VGKVARHTNKYSKGCRCDICRESHRLANLRNRRRNGIAPRTRKGPAHGKMEYDKGCRCGECLGDIRRRNQERRARRERLSLSGVPHPHGLSGYRGWSCRCDVCREAHRESQERDRTQVQKRVQQGTVSVPHGTIYGYNRFRCRCVLCVAVAYQRTRTESPQAELARLIRQQQADDQMSRRGRLGLPRGSSRSVGAPVHLERDLGTGHHTYLDVIIGAVSAEDEYLASIS